MARISRRLSRIVPSLILLAGLIGPAEAAETVVLKSRHASFQATLALDEFQAYDQRGAVAGAVPIAGRIGAMRVAGGTRAQLELAARNMLGQGLASKVAPVLWFNGAVGNPGSRIEVDRQILIEPATGVTIDDLMQAHGLVKAVPVDFRAGWWMAEPADPSLLAPLDALTALQADPRVALAYPNLRQPKQSYINDPMLKSDQPGPVPGPYPWHLLPVLAAANSSLDIGGNRVGAVWTDGDDTGKVWQDYSAVNANIMIVDDGVQLDHPDLTTRPELSASFTTGGATGGNPYGIRANHATFVATTARHICGSHPPKRRTNGAQKR